MGHWKHNLSSTLYRLPLWVLPCVYKHVRSLYRQLADQQCPKKVHKMS
jgi:hypothetical protein